MAAAEKEKLLGQMTQHKVRMSSELDDGINRRDGSWFDKWGRYFDPLKDVYMVSAQQNPNGMPDVIGTRGVLAHYFGIAYYPECFYATKIFKDEDVKPTERDRHIFADWIEFYATVTGLLNEGEITSIKLRGFWNEDITKAPKDIIHPQKEHKILQFDEVAAKAAAWKLEGWKIALFHGAFDPVTPSHLECANFAYMHQLKDGVPTKLIIGFDSDTLIKRKGTDRPRYNIEDRRKAFGSFWMVDATVEMNARQSVFTQFAADYLRLGVDYVVTTNNFNEIMGRLEAINVAGAIPLVVPKNPLPSATEILSNI